MKKTFIIFSAAIFSLFAIGGCSAFRDYHELEQTMMISAFGADCEDGEFIISLEMIDVEENNDNTEYSPTVVSDSGLTIEQAVAKIGGRLSKELFFSHCAIVAVGDSLTPDRFEQVMDYCFTESEITLSVQIVAAPSAAELLSCKSVSETMVGYDIMTILQDKKRRLGFGHRDGFVEVENARKGTTGVFSLPYFEISGEDEKEYSPTGLKVFRKNTAVGLLSAEDSAVSEMMSGYYSGGRITLDNDGTVAQGYVKSSTCDVKWAFDGDRLAIDMDISLSMDDVQTASFGKSDIASGIKTRAETLAARAAAEKVDLFGIGDRILKNDFELWKRIGAEYPEYFSRAEFHITCTAGQEEI